MSTDIESVLSFWFEEIEPEKWWVKDFEFDGLIETRFLSLLNRAVQCELHEWRTSGRGCLAEVIVLDQFSRNIFRDTPGAFSADPLALALAQSAISAGKDKELNAVERSFLYMPFMHSESLEIHEHALRLYEANGIESNLKFEIAHRNIIEQFGRYPHRNEILGRASTKEEIEFLKQPDSGF